MKSDLRVALIGNPNTGKSSLFNVLTGLSQKVGNFPGVTVDKKTGYTRLADNQIAEIIDLPGTYSLYPKSKDESIVLEVLANPKNSVHPDLIVFIADASNLKRNLLLYTQVADLKIPIIIALNMMDLAEKAGTIIQIDELSRKLGVRVVPISARKEKGIDDLKMAIAESGKIALQYDTINLEELFPGIIKRIQGDFLIEHPYVALHHVHQHAYFNLLTPKESTEIAAIGHEFRFQSSTAKAKEIISRYEFINDVLYDTVSLNTSAEKETYSNRIDKFLTHRIWGFAIFFAILFFIFQAIFSWAQYPMELIELLFVKINEIGKHYLPEGPFSDLLLEGVVAGLSGVLVFIPQIAILFVFISILEDTGYMARVTFMLDKIMRKVGLNGKSVIPLIGGLACAVPSIMSARGIENWKDRIITILVTPLVTCSARLPVYALLISLIVPKETILGFINLQGLALMFMYILGIVSAILVAWVLKFLINSREKGYFIMELPVYQMPRWKNVLLTMVEKVKAFVFQAGKVIIAVSIILWVLASYGPGNTFQEIEMRYSSLGIKKAYKPQEIERMVGSEKIESSYAGLLGKTIEPLIRPLGYDWKIGIALITSFAAREVFVGTMATIYSAEGDDDNQDGILQKVKEAKHAKTGLPVFTTAVAFSLLIFYAYAMQCMSTLVIVYRETKSLKWPLVQFAYMTGMAYVLSFLVYNLLS